jgi:hypothetical protein
LFFAALNSAVCQAAESGCGLNTREEKTMVLMGAACVLIAGACILAALRSKRINATPKVSNLKLK